MKSILSNAFHKQERGLTLTPEGNGGYELKHNLMPKKPQTPAQHAAVKKAAAASASKRRTGFKGIV